jgi:hypothetical protein
MRDTEQLTRDFVHSGSFNCFANSKFPISHGVLFVDDQAGILVCVSRTVRYGDLGIPRVLAKELRGERPGGHPCSVRVTANPATSAPDVTMTCPPAPDQCGKIVAAVIEQVVGYRMPEDTVYPPPTLLLSTHVFKTMGTTEYGYKLDATEAVKYFGNHGVPFILYTTHLCKAQGTFPFSFIRPDGKIVPDGTWKKGQTKKNKHGFLSLAIHAYTIVIIGIKSEANLVAVRAMLGRMFADVATKCMVRCHARPVVEEGGGNSRLL